MFKFAMIAFLMISTLNGSESEEVGKIAIPRGRQIAPGHLHSECATGQRGMIVFTIEEYLGRVGIKETTCTGCNTPLIPNAPCNSRRPLGR